MPTRYLRGFDRIEPRSRPRVSQRRMNNPVDKLGDGLWNTPRCPVDACGIKLGIGAVNAA